MDGSGDVALLCRGTERVVGTEDLQRKLTEGRPLRVKLGLDPTAPDIHLGHTVVLRKARDFQDLGHDVHIVIGDFTGRIGDPSGKTEARRQLSADEVARNAETYVHQLHKILVPARTHIAFNSEWLGPLRFADVLTLASRTTVARLLERDDFAGRFRQGRPIHLHEFFYALMQGYDSVALRADVELGGTDQKFNLLCGRELQRVHGQPPQIVLMTPILEGLDGVQKMSKSLGNAIGIHEPPAEMYGKLMSISDELMWKYWALLTDLRASAIQSMQQQVAGGQLHPMEAKKQLARTLVADFHGIAESERADQNWARMFQQKSTSEDVDEQSVAYADLVGPSGAPGALSIRLPRLLTALGLAASGAEASRKIAEGAVKLDGTAVTQSTLPIEKLPTRIVVRLGKRARAALIH